MKSFLVLSIALLFALPAFAMTADGCGAGTCNDCHSITKEETEQLLGGMVNRVNDVEFSEIPGMWVAEVVKGGQKIPVYIDFSKQYLVFGNVIRLGDKQNMSRQRSIKMNTVDVNSIPLKDALLLGKPSAKNKVIVFTDPQCPFCKKLHIELKEVVKRDPDIAFLIKLFPLTKLHPNAYQISKSIICNKSMELLELSFADKPVPPPICTADSVDQTLALVRELDITSTPTLVMPNGLVVPGYKKADALINVINQNQGSM